MGLYRGSLVSDCQLTNRFELHVLCSRPGTAGNDNGKRKDRNIPILPFQAKPLYSCLQHWDSVCWRHVRAELRKAQTAQTAMQTAYSPQTWMAFRRESCHFLAMRKRFRVNLCCESLRLAHQTGLLRNHCNSVMSRLVPCGERCK